MIKMIMKYEVEDFAKWKAGYMAAESIRKNAGAKSTQAFQGADNPKMVAVITEWDSLEKAKAFSQSPELKEAQQKAGVSTKPEVYELKSI